MLNISLENVFYVGTASGAMDESSRQTSDLGTGARRPYLGTDHQRRLIGSGWPYIAAGRKVIRDG
jgi:hypothetical protein